MIENKKLIFKVSTSIIKFALKIVYFGSFLVWKLFFRRNIPTKWSVKLTGSTSTIEMRFSESTSRPLQICPSETIRQNGWLILKLPLALKRIQFWIIISHKQWKTMNARSGLRRIQAEIFPGVARMEKIWVIFWVLDQRTDYVRSSKRRER